jgi:hypothetical protein
VVSPSSPTSSVNRAPGACGSTQPAQCDPTRHRRFVVLLSAHERGRIMKLMHDPDYWLLRAEEARIAANSMPNENARRFLLEIADGYERIAKSAMMKRAEPTDT